MGTVHVDGPRGTSGRLRLDARGGATGRLGGRAVRYGGRASAARATTASEARGDSPYGRAVAAPAAARLGPALSTRA